jgi:hypothetical protein
MMKRTEILNKAAEIITGDRNETHGDAQKTFARIASYWGVYLGLDVTPAQVAEMMVLLKVARSQAGCFNADDYIDCVGYSALAGELAGQKIY